VCYASNEKVTQILHDRTFVSQIIQIGNKTTNDTQPGRQMLHMLYWILDNIARDLDINRDKIVNAGGLEMVHHVSTGQLLIILLKHFFILVNEINFFS
jgi:hypothetical protein